MAIDLTQVVIVNESSDPNRAGDVELFETIADAESYLEPIDVRNEENFAYLLNGTELKLFIAAERKWFGEIVRVRIEPARAAPDHTDRVRSLFEAAAAAVQRARKRRKGIEPDRKPSEMTIVELTELIGFTR